MNDELIRKSEALELIDSLRHANPEICNVFAWSAVLMEAGQGIEELPPVNAVELPCKIGDILFEVCVACGGIHKREVHGFNIRENGMFIVCDTTNFEKREIGKQVFFIKGRSRRNISASTVLSTNNVRQPRIAERRLRK